MNKKHIPLMVLSFLVLAIVACSLDNGGPIDQTLGIGESTTAASATPPAATNAPENTVTSQNTAMPEATSTKPLAAATSTYIPVKPTATNPPAPTKLPPVSKTDWEDVAKLAQNVPFETAVQKDQMGRSVTTLKGFDLDEYGGDDSACTRTTVDEAALHEEVGSPSEDCKIVVEWSLKYGAHTIISGVYAVQPHEWFRIVGNVSGQDRFVGTIRYLPKGYNAHMYAADIAAEWAPKNPGLTTYVGLSPTDPFVVSLANMLVWH